jgi:hypothetical protein
MHHPSWKETWTTPRSRKSWLLSVLFLILVLAGLAVVLVHAEQRKGIVIETGWLSFVRPLDLSVFIFWGTYGFALLGVIIAFRNPDTALRLVQAYTILSLLRCLTLLLVPLAAHPEIIPLDDLLLRNTFYAGRPNLNDLFFSGHTATLVLFALLLPGKKWGLLFGAVACAIGVMLILQRVHYISDVVAAPLFALIAWRLTRQPVMLRR